MKIYLIIALALAGFSATAQCEPEDFCKTCLTRLRQSNFNFLKSFKIHGEDGSLMNVEYSYVLTKGSRYMINICADSKSPDKILFTLLDKNRTTVATNESNSRMMPDFVFQCNATGIYYLKYTFNDAPIGCAGITLGFERENASSPIAR